MNEFSSSSECLNWNIAQPLENVLCFQNSLSMQSQDSCHTSVGRKITHTCTDIFVLLYLYSHLQVPSTAAAYHCWQAKNHLPTLTVSWFHAHDTSKKGSSDRSKSLKIVYIRVKLATRLPSVILRGAQRLWLIHTWRPQDDILRWQALLTNPAAFPGTVTLCVLASFVISIVYVSQHTMFNIKAMSHSTEKAWSIIKLTRWW